MAKNTPTRARPGQLRRVPVTGTGPRDLGLQRKPDRQTGPGEPPPGFVRATTSLSEWWVYWALAKFFDDPRDPRQPPFFGGRDWGYQIAAQGGRKEPGGAVVDFVVYLIGETVGIRLQTDRFHLAAGPEKQAYDEAQARNLSRQMTVKDLYEQDYIGDKSGESVVRIIADTIGGRGRVNPLRSGTYRSVRIGT